MLFRLVDLFGGAVVPLIAVLLYFGAIQRAGVRKTVLAALFTLYLAEVLDVVGVPYIQTLAWKPVMNWIPFADLGKGDLSFWTIFQFAANIVLFLPFGGLLPMIWKRFRRLGATVLAGALTSLGIELLQLFSPRVTAVDDLLMNTLGTALGFWIVAGCSKKRWAKADPTSADGEHAGLELLLIALLTVLSTVFLKYGINSRIYDLLPIA